MKQWLKVVLIVGGILLVLTGFLIIDHFIHRIPENPPGTVGNTAGNLYNGGYFCEDSNSKVYFANSYDNGALYVMNADETGLEKIVDGTVKSINTGGDYLYFFMSSTNGSTGLGFVRQVIGVYRCEKDGSNMASISRDPAGTLLLADNSLYIQSLPDGGGVNLLKASIDGEDKTVVSTDKIYPASCVNGRIYYNNNSGSLFLHQWDINTDTSGEVVKYNMWNPTRQGDYVYFMDISNDYRLCRYHMQDANIEVLSEDRVDTFNVTDQYVFYQKSSETQPALMRVNLDGSEEVLIEEGVFNNLNATSQYLYFQQFGNDITIYHVPINGTEASEFTAAAQTLSLSL